ncbi:MAG: hypothetical protein JWM55_53 [Acidimicrobiaceae bacterium]|nr:hypothetical protein [Acidimicrobiaceae bacterium]
MSLRHPFAIGGDVAGWVRRHDPNFMALRRATRTAIVMPALFAFCVEVADNSAMATYAAFGSIALLMLVDFSGSLRARLQAQAWLCVTGAVLIGLGTLTSQTLWLSVLAMGVVAVVVLFSGVLSSVIASAATSLLLVFILSTAEAGPVAIIPDRLAGWGLASLASLVAVGLFWPAHNRDPLRLAAATACRALARRLRADVAHWSGDDTLDPVAYEGAIETADQATDALHRGFLAAPWRPTGLSVTSRATVRLVDEILWLDTLVDQAARPTERSASHQYDCRIRSSSAAILDIGADELESPSISTSRLGEAREELAIALKDLTHNATSGAPLSLGGDALTPNGEVPSERGREEETIRYVNSLEPSFRAQEIGFVASLVGATIDLVSAAERRSWFDTMVGAVPGDPTGRLGAARESAAAHLNWRSVWLHNSLRGAAGLAIAVLIAEKTGVQHAFWVILGTLSVLRSSAVNTGANALRALLGTAIGFILGAVLLVGVGTNVTVLWFLLPVAILVAGFAPAAISFAAGQAGFTFTLVILWNILGPIGWRVGLYRIEDVAIGCAVSVGVGLFFWPRGAASALGATLREAYVTSAAFLSAAVIHGAGRFDRGSDPSTSPLTEGTNAAAASRRLDDAFRTYLGERGSKPIPLADAATLLRGVVSLRQTADAIVNLWEGDAGHDEAARTGEASQLSKEVRLIESWYDNFGAALTGAGELPVPVVESLALDPSLLDEVDNYLRVAGADAGATAVRLVWTKDYLGATRRLEETLVGPARAASPRALGSAVVPAAGEAGSFE